MSTSRFPSSRPESESLISAVTQHFTPDVIHYASSMTGESASSSQQALHAAVPTVLFGLTSLASTGEGQSRLSTMVRESRYSGLAENPLSLFRGGSSTNYLMSAGQQHLGTLFGGNLSSVVETVAQSSGVGTSSANKLLALVTPLTLGVLGQRVSAEGLGSARLGELLLSQKASTADAAPSGLSRVLGLGPKAVPAPATGVQRETVLSAPSRIEHFSEALPVGGRRTPSRNRWFPLALVLAGIVLLAYLIGRPRTPRVGDLASRGISSARNALTSVTLPGGVNLSVPRDSISYSLANFLGDTSATGLPRTFVFDHLNFESASTQLTPDSAGTVNQVAQVLRAYPNAQVQLVGNTDNTGTRESNQKLSEDRADAVKTMLVNQGVRPDRISTQGLGQDHPVAPNDTEEGRARNRRIELNVTHK